jgi:hypothetical protein
MRPTFIGIGPARCGTTSVYHYLKQHPQVFMSPVKETHFFAYQVSEPDFLHNRAILDEPVRSLEAYEMLFKDADTAKAAGEISPCYFWWDGVPAAIRRTIPAAVIFCILRNPVDRAYSSYRMHVDNGTEIRSFEQVVSAELDSPSKYPLAAENYFIRIGFYARHLTRYVEQFGRRGVKICFYDDLERSASRFMRELFSFIGVDPNVVVNTSARFNTLGVRRVEQRFRKHGLGPLSRRLRSLIPEQLYHLVYRGYSAAATGAAALPPMSPEMRERLRDVYAADIAALQVLTGRDLSPWLQA